jgi:hypothetical protein
MQEAIMRRPRITQSVIEGILEATGPAMACNLDEGDYRDTKYIPKAEDWALGMRAWMRHKGTWKEDAHGDE